MLIVLVILPGPDQEACDRGSSQEEADPRYGQDQPRQPGPRCHQDRRDIWFAP